MSTTRAHRNFVSNLLGTSSTKNIQPCINGKTLSLDFVRKRRPKQEHRVIPSRKYSSTSGDIYLPCAMPDNPLAQHLHQLALEAMNAPNEHVEDIDSTQSPRSVTRSVRTRRAREEQRGTRDRRDSAQRTAKHEPKSRAAPRSEISRTILGNKTKYITEQQPLLNKRTPSVTRRTVPSVNNEPVRSVTAVNVSNLIHETPVTPCTRSRVMFAGSTPGCELMSQRPHSDTSDRSRHEDDTCHSSELQFDSSPMILTNGWSTCHTATPRVSTDARTNQVPAHTVPRASSDSSDTPPSTFKWHVIESLTRDQHASPPESPLPLAPDESSTPKQRTIQRLFQQNCYLKRRVRDLTQHLLQANKTSYL